MNEWVFHIQEFVFQIDDQEYVFEVAQLSEQQVPLDLGGFVITENFLGALTEDVLEKMFLSKDISISLRGEKRTFGFKFGPLQYDRLQQFSQSLEK